MNPSIFPPSMSAIELKPRARSAAVDVGMIDEGGHAGTGGGIGNADRRLSVRHRNPVRPWIGAEVRIERAVLLHDHDDVTDGMDVVRVAR